MLEPNKRRTTRCFFIGRGLVPFIPVTTEAGGVAGLLFCSGEVAATDSSNSLFFPRFWERSAELCSVGPVLMAVVGICGRPVVLKGTGLGVVVRGPGARSVCAGVAEIGCGKLPEGCDFASFLSSFCIRLSSMELGDKKRIS